MNVTGKWRFWIDRGGTFTDVWAEDPDQRVHVHKLLSESSHVEDATIQGIRDLLGLASHQPLPAHCVESVILGTTVGTNALLERKGARVGLLITRGFKDALRIGYQNRPDLFALQIQLQEPLYETVVEVDERVTAEREVLIPLDLSSLETELSALKSRGIEALAVVLMHAVSFPEHEKRVGALARSMGFEQVSLSHQVSPRIRAVARGDTTVLNAYLSPRIREYVDRLRARLPETGIWFMKSHGGLALAEEFEGKDSLLSGPAGGIVGAARVGAMCGMDQLISFDMGGTSTDVAAYSGSLDCVQESEVAGLRIRVPMLRIHTIAAGGGSVVRVDKGRFVVGPESAGSAPGPACYRRGGPLTLTDCNLVVGRIVAEHFPEVFGPEGNQRLDRDVVEQKMRHLAWEVEQDTGAVMEPALIAQGMIQVAVESMACAIKTISVERGVDVREFALCSFGGAGGQHACGVAEALGIRTIVIHPHAGLLSAFGLRHARLGVIEEMPVEAWLDGELMELLRPRLQTMQASVRKQLDIQGAQADSIRVPAFLRLRVEYAEFDLAVPWSSLEEMRGAFQHSFREQFGFDPEADRLRVSAVVVEGFGALGEGLNSPSKPAVQGAPQPVTLTPLLLKNGWKEVPLYRRKDCQPGHQLQGPCLIAEDHSTTVVDSGWRARVLDGDILKLTLGEAAHRVEGFPDALDPVLLEVFNNRFMAVAEQMGAVLRKTSQSVNIKERLDFSCALFDREGVLVANAPHLPVHLGSMSDSVRAIIRRFHGQMLDGDVFATNDPFDGGTHLPDITAVTPVFAKGQLLYFVASRGHHADIGGKTPGSMPPLSSSIEEEGVLLPGMLIVRQGQFLADELTRVLQQGPHPARNIPQNLADLKAQVAANEKGKRELLEMTSAFTADRVHAYMRYVQDLAEESTRCAIARLSDGSWSYELDDGTWIKVKVQVDRVNRKAVLDFGGTSPQQPNQRNAPRAVTKAAVLYVFRTLVAESIPLNEGSMKPLEIHLPPGSMLDPAYPAAVVGGNVETSQAVTNALLLALGVLAASQGTMNNLTFGDNQWQYYETICGGAGAGPGFHGAHAVHTHMTNSRLTDPEVLEMRFPVLVTRFEIRRHSGGAGQFRGGDGVIREILFRKPLTAAIISSHRRVPTPGLLGGHCGKVGVNTLIRADDSREHLGSDAVVMVNPGDRVRIETPGGGGFGRGG